MSGLGVVKEVEPLASLKVEDVKGEGAQGVVGRSAILGMDAQDGEELRAVEEEEEPAEQART